eukprot:gene45019-22138_t
MGGTMSVDAAGVSLSMGEHGSDESDDDGTDEVRGAHNADILMGSVMGTIGDMLQA